MTIKKKLAIIKVCNELDRAGLANLLGVCEDTVINWATRGIPPTSHNLQSIEREFKKCLEDLRNY
jgi:hypothetical protein